MAINRRLNLLESFFGESIKGKRGVEFGPYDRPFIRRDMCADVSYADVFSTKELRLRARANPLRDEKEVVFVDYVTLNDTINELVSPESLDFVFCSHMLEHVPDMISQLQQIHQCLKVGGELLIAYPDRRYTFDIDRNATTFESLAFRHKNKHKKPSPEVVYDYVVNYKSVMVGRLWQGMEGAVGPNLYSPADAEKQAKIASDEYVDCHCNIFTDLEFVEVIKMLRTHNYINFDVSEVYGTIAPNNEFLIKLKKIT
jgi:SAM-dependent methyltransferase